MQHLEESDGYRLVQEEEVEKAKFNLGFMAATLSFLMVFAASAAPIPLYDLYLHTGAIFIVGAHFIDPLAS